MNINYSKRAEADLVSIHDYIADETEIDVIAVVHTAMQYHPTIAERNPALIRTG